MINDTGRQLLQLLDAAIHKRAAMPLTSEQWTAVFQELKQQCVQAMPASVIGGVGLTQADRTQYIGAVGRSVMIFYRIMDTQKALLELLEQAQIPAVILKGSSAAMNYPSPEYRCMGDIDLIVLPEQFETAYHVMREAGYQTEETLEDYHRHIGFRAPSSVLIELHNHFSSSSDANRNAILDTYVYEGIRQREAAMVCGYRTSVLPPLANGLVLLGHVNQHLGGGLGLRQILDWQCYVERHLSDEMWHDSFEAAAEQIGMKQLALAVTAMCKKYLGLSEEIHWCDVLSDDSICEELMTYILSHGNFGRKDAVGSTTISVIRIFRNPIQAAITLQQTGCRTWKLLKKYPCMKPFAWLYQIFRWISHGVRRGVKVSDMSGYSEREKKETDFLRRLGITRL